MGQSKKSSISKRMSVEEALKICHSLPIKEHARIVNMVIECIGPENIDTVAFAMHQSIVRDIINNEEMDINDARSLLSTFLMILYIQGSIILREKEKS